MTYPALPPRTPPLRAPPPRAGSGPALEGSRAEATQPLLEIRDLRVWFDTSDGRIHAVNGISLDLAGGETVALVGESGCGKSASMLAVMGLVAPPGRASGRVLFDGRDLMTLPSREMRRIRGRGIAMVFQDPMSSLNPVMTVGNQVDEVLRLHLGLTARQARARTVELLDRVGIPDAASRAADHPHQFSGGMRQRVMIAMALAAGPRILIADEPTTALDVTIQAQIVALVRDLQDEFGMSVIWITHDLGVVASLASRVAVMYGGRIVEEGPVGQIYAACRHPYTAGLLRSVPRLDTPMNQRLAEIPGTPPEMKADAAACTFAVRCPMADEGCSSGRPPLVATDLPRHRSACLHWQALAAHAEPFPAQRLERPPARTRNGGPLVEIEELKVYFPIRQGWRRAVVGAIRAVDGVSLSVERGETLGLVGESGSGKTTLGRTVLRLTEPTGGRILFDGTDLTAVNGGELRRSRRRMQMVFQDPAAAMNSGMRIRDVIAEPLEVQQVGTGAAIRARVAELLDLVGLPRGASDRFPHEFSGGQRQRVVIARALALEPEFLVCDEPISSLDVSVQAQILNLLHQLQHELGLTYLFIAHDLAVVRHISTRVAVMYLGRIVEVADREEIYTRPLHPYTEALLRSAPVPDPRIASQRREPAVQGDLPSPAKPPPGCRFHTRCPIAVRGLCDVQEPALREIAPRRLVACHLAASPAATGAVAEPASEHARV
jgi:oligopeptide/dipeptide ABC transporter ATP-binding protein